MPFSDILKKKNRRGLGGMLASKGNKGDTILAHINPEEARLLKMMGGSGTINPKTGLRQFFNNTDVTDIFGRMVAPLEPTYEDRYGQYVKNFNRGEGDITGLYAEPLPFGNWQSDIAKPEDAERIRPRTDEERYSEFIKPYQSPNEGDNLDSWAVEAKRQEARDKGEWDWWNPGHATNYGRWLAQDVPEEPVKPYSSGAGEHLGKTDSDFRPPRNWDPALYLKNNPDLVDDPWAKANPLAHFSTFGNEEGRGRIPGGYANANFEQARRLYLENNPDVLKAQADPWEHYETSGKGEGRKWIGKEPGYDFSDAKLNALFKGIPGDRAQGIGEAIRAIRRGYIQAPATGEPEPSEAQGGIGGTSTRRMPGETPLGWFPPGEKVDVDKYGWIEITKDMKDSGRYVNELQPGGHYNILTGTFLRPDEKVSQKNKGQAIPRGSGSDFWNALGGITKGLVGGVFGEPGGGKSMTESEAGLWTLKKIAAMGMK